MSVKNTFSNCMKIDIDSDFPFIVDFINSRYSSPLIECHWHTYVEFIYIVSGKAVFQIDGVSLEAHENQAVIVNGGETHSAYTVDNSHCVLHVVIFDLNILCSSSFDTCQSLYIAPFINKLLKLPNFITGSSHWEKVFSKELGDIVNICKKRVSGWQLCVKASLFKIISLFYMNNALVEEPGESEKIIKSKIERLKSIINYIQENYHRHISIEVLSRSVNLSQSHFFYFFRSLTGETPVDYINCCRIRHAAKLLEDENKKIVDIAFDVGFDNLSYFNKVFKKYKKCTPSEFRRHISINNLIV